MSVTENTTHSKAKIGFALSFLLMSLVIIFLPNYSHHVDKLSKISRIRADQRSISIAIDSYFSDHGVLPVPDSKGYVPSSLTTPVAYYISIPGDYTRVTYAPKSIFDYLVILQMKIVELILILILAAIHLYCFIRLKGLLSPISRWFYLIPFLIAVILSYLKNDFFFSEEFPRLRLKVANPEAVEYRMGYLPIEDGFLIHSHGPFGSPHLGNPTELLTPGITSAEVQEKMLLLSYDPTNGSHSRGDIFRFHPIVFPTPSP